MTHSSPPRPAVRSFRFLCMAVLVAGLAALAGCAAVQQFAALSRVRFDFDRISDVRLAGVLLTGRTSYEDLGVTDVARIAAGIALHDVPLEFTAHLQAENPASNSVTARLTALDWNLLIDNRGLVDGKLDRGYAFEPGKPVDVPVVVGFDAYDLYAHGTRDLVELALAVAGVEGYGKEVRLDLRPTVETDLGPIRYPEPITVRRGVGSAAP